MKKEELIKAEDLELYRNTHTKQIELIGEVYKTYKSKPESMLGHTIDLILCLYNKNSNVAKKSGLVLITLAQQDIKMLCESYYFKLWDYIKVYGIGIASKCGKFIIVRATETYLSNKKERDELLVTPYKPKTTEEVPKRSKVCGIDLPDWFYDSNGNLKNLDPNDPEYWGDQKPAKWTKEELENLNL